MHSKIQVSEVRIPGLEAFLGFVFGSELYVRIAKKIVEATPYKAGNWFVFCERNEIKPRTYHDVLRLLKQYGLVEKTNETINLSKEFSRRLTKLSEYWSDYIESRKEIGEIT